MTNQIFSSLKVIALAIVLSFGLSYVYAWTAPSGTPPTGNVSAPLNTSATAQVKTGALTVTQLTTTTGTLTSSKDITANGVNVGRGGGNMSSNTSVGLSALLSNTIGYYNTAMGWEALLSNTTGSFNTANGVSALRANISGSLNTATGYLALLSNAASANTATGYGSLYQNTIGNSNTADGSVSLSSNTTGSNNSAFGQGALAGNKTGSNNTAVGAGGTMWNSVSGSENTAIGFQAMWANTTGYNNTAIGRTSLYTNATGYNNTAIGYGADVSTGGSPGTCGWAPCPVITNSTVIGAGAIVDRANKVRIGNDAVTVIEGPVGLTTPSDKRLKENVFEYTHGLDFITKLRPVSYSLKSDSTHKEHSGFIAQEVESTEIPFYGINRPETKDGYYSLNYAEFVVPLVNSVKELKAENDKLRSDNDALLSRIELIEAKLK